MVELLDRIDGMIFAFPFSYLIFYLIFLKFLMKKKKLQYLGSTGSIGKSLLKIISKNKKNFKIILLTANKNYKLIIKTSKKI